MAAQPNISNSVNAANRVGIGISAPAASWGTLANEARTLIESYPIQIIWPVLSICLTMLSLNFIGDGVSDAFDPKKK